MNYEHVLSAIIIVCLILLIPIGYRIFVPEDFRDEQRRTRTRRVRFLADILTYSIPLGIVYALVHMQDTIGNFLGIDPQLNYASYFIMLEGNRVSLFQSIATPLLTYISGIVYLILFPFLLVFTFLILAYTQKLRVLEEFVAAFILIYLIAFPFYVLFPVEVTGYTLHNVQPILYNLSPIIAGGVRVMDPGLDNCFPSLHAALSVMAMLIILLRTDLKNFKIFAVLTTITIQFTILYLGIHWISDLLAGSALALISYYVATNYRTGIIDLSYRFTSSLIRLATTLIQRKDEDGGLK
ncbi:MAG: phosphatase PAP2 family protein [Euryarchaeota archaeon]|nr:phosphatase PAP2 family protein [Euryarchaeota archaeon]